MKRWARLILCGGVGFPAMLGMPTFPAFADSMAADSANMSQVTSVAQLSDVKPTDWAFQALQSLVERHGCIAGYPDRQFKGDRAMTRYEFAAGLNACMERVQQLLAGDNLNAASQADRASLNKLQTEFATELATLRGRVDRLDTQVGRLESQQFSPTTRLYGQTILGLQGTNKTQVDFFPRDGVLERQAQAPTSFGYNTQLSLASSFRGDDLLLVGLQTGNVRSNAPNLSTNMGRLSYESEANSQLLLSDLSYRFRLGQNFGVLAGPIGVNPESTFRGINPLEGNGEGALSQFGQRNPILNVGNTNGGVGFDWQIADRLSLQAVYSAALAAQPGSGLFEGGHTIGAQLSIAPTNTIDIGLNYLASRSPDGVIGAGVGDSQVLSPFTPTATGFNTQAIGATLAWRVTPRVTIGTWGGWTRSRAIAVEGTVETTNWMAFSAFPDLFAAGNLGGIMVGQPPKITRSTLPTGLNFPSFSTDGAAGGQPNSSLQLEAFYRAKLNSRISVTPGLLMIFNPNHNKANETIVQGILRATYQF
jgi:hypothetical protein